MLCPIQGTCRRSDRRLRASTATPSDAEPMGTTFRDAPGACNAQLRSAFRCAGGAPNAITSDAGPPIGTTFWDASGACNARLRFRLSVRTGCAQRNQQRRWLNGDDGPGCVWRMQCAATFPPIGAHGVRPTRSPATPGRQSERRSGTRLAHAMRSYVHARSCARRAPSAITRDIARWSPFSIGFASGEAAGAS